MDPKTLQGDVPCAVETQRRLGDDYATISDESPSPS